MRPLGSNCLTITTGNRAKSRPKQVIQNQSYSLARQLTTSKEDSSDLDSDVCENVNDVSSFSDLKAGTLLFTKNAQQTLFFLSYSKNPNELILVDEASHEIIWLDKSEVEIPS